MKDTCELSKDSGLALAFLNSYLATSFPQRDNNYYLLLKDIAVFGNNLHSAQQTNARMIAWDFMSYNSYSPLFYDFHTTSCGSFVASV